MDYGEILGRSWRIAWNNKFLWVLGFLAAFTSGGGNVSFSSPGELPAGMEMPDLAELVPRVIAIVCIALFFGLLLVLLSLMARNGLIYAADQLDEGRHVTLGDAFGAGWRALGRVIGVALLLYLPLILLAVIIIMLATAGALGSFTALDPTQLEAEGSEFGLLIICLALLICCLAVLIGVVSIVLLFIRAFAVRGVVLQGLGVVEAIRHGWQVLRNNLPETIVLALIFFFMNVLLSLALLVVLLPFIVIVVVALASGDFQMDDLGLAALVPIVATGLCYALLAAALSSIFVTWQSTAFTLAYREFTAK